MIPKSYVGITGFTTFEEVAKTTKLFQNNFINTDLRFHIGAMQSYETLNRLPSRWTQSYPHPENLGSIFLKHSEKNMNCIHYVDSKSRSRISDIAQLLEQCDKNNGLDAVQFDIAWPLRDFCEYVKNFRPPSQALEVILQIGGHALEQCGNDRDGLVHKIKSYGNTIDHVLFDLSLGKGEPMDAQFLLPYILKTREKFPNLGIAVAGGLGPETMDLVVPIISEVSHISIDAEGRLRSSGNAMDPIDWKLAEKYLVEAGKRFTKTSVPG